MKRNPRTTTCTKCGSTIAAMTLFNATVELRTPAGVNLAFCDRRCRLGYLARNNLRTYDRQP